MAITRRRTANERELVGTTVTMPESSVVGNIEGHVVGFARVAGGRFVVRGIRQGGKLSASEHIVVRDARQMGGKHSIDYEDEMIRQMLRDAVAAW